VLAGVRGDRIATVPLDSTETLLLRDVRSREFAAVTGALGVRAPISGGWTASVQLARAFRPPSIEELFSAGPHLASYAYEIGVPDRSRRSAGWGSTHCCSGRGAAAAWSSPATPCASTGTSPSRPRSTAPRACPMRDPRLRRYVVYRPQQADARL
jgi:hypothetical protein